MAKIGQNTSSQQEVTEPASDDRYYAVNDTKSCFSFTMSSRLCAALICVNIVLVLTYAGSAVFVFTKLSNISQTNEAINISDRIEFKELVSIQLYLYGLGVGEFSNTYLHNGIFCIKIVIVKMFLNLFDPLYSYFHNILLEKKRPALII